MRPWILCFVASTSYLGLFALRGFVAKCDDDDEIGFGWLCGATAPLLQGFCTFGLSGNRCESQLWNSHAGAFAVDVVLSLVAIGIAIFKATAFTGTVKFLPAALSLLIVFHGLLHAVFAANHCFIDPSTKLAPFLYLAFVLALVTVIVFFFWGWSKRSGGLVVFLSAAIFLITMAADDFPLPCLFASSHFLVSVAGLWAPNRALLTDTLAWIFLLPTVVGLIEFLACDVEASFGLRHIGGHLWYDLTLHVTFIVELFLVLGRNRNDE